MIGVYLQIAWIILLINCLSHAPPGAYFGELLPLYLRYFFDPIDRSYIEVISKLYRRNTEQMSRLYFLSYPEKTPANGLMNIFWLLVLSTRNKIGISAVICKPVFYLSISNIELDKVIAWLGIFVPL